MAQDYSLTRQVDEVAGVPGAQVDDPYQWLEEDSPEVAAWQEEQNAFSRAHLHAWPHFSEVRRAALEYSGPDFQSIENGAPIYAGGLWFSMGTSDGGAHAVVVVAEAPGEPVRCVLDPRSVTGDDTALLAGFSPSPDGRLLAFWVSSRGSEHVTLHVVETETGRELSLGPSLVYDGSVASAAWLPDSSGFFCNPLTDDPGQFVFRVVLQRMDGTRQVEIPSVDGTFVNLAVSADGSRVIVNDPVARKPLFVRDMESGAWTPLLRGIEGIFSGVVVGEHFYAVTSVGAPRGRLVKIPLASADDASTWAELIAPSDAVLVTCLYRGDALIVHELVDTYARVRLLALDGTDRGEIGLPAPGSAGSILQLAMGDRRPTGSTYVFPFETFDSSRAWYAYDVAARELRQLTVPQRRIAGTTTRIERCLAADGTPLTYHLVHRSDLDTSLPHPVLAHGYGDGRAPWLPTFAGIFQPFIDAGGIYVHLNLRGGGEYGEDFFRAGTIPNKANTFRDAHAIAEDMIAKGISEPRRIGVVGESSGGLLAGAVATQRPDLYGVCVPRVPMADLLRLAEEPYGLAAVRTLWGDPTTVDGVRALLEISPYHLVREGVAYPAMLVEAGDADHRCPPWHARKLAARLQNSTSGEQPVLLRVWSDTGHASGIDPAVRAEQVAEFISFAMMTFDLEPGGGRR